MEQESNMKYRKKKTKLFKNGSLNDEAVLSAIDRARRDYEDGAIIEAYDALLEVINAIDDFAHEN